MEGAVEGGNTRLEIREGERDVEEEQQRMEEMNADGKGGSGEGKRREEKRREDRQAGRQRRWGR